MRPSDGERAIERTDQFLKVLLEAALPHGVFIVQPLANTGNCPSDSVVRTVEEKAFNSDLGYATTHIKSRHLIQHRCFRDNASLKECDDLLRHCRTFSPFQIPSSKQGRRCSTESGQRSRMDSILQRAISRSSLRWGWPMFLGKIVRPVGYE